MPVCDPRKSGILDDPRLPYYSSIEKWTAKYAVAIGIYGAYSHGYETARLEDLVQFDSIVIKSGVMGYLDGALFC